MTGPGSRVPGVSAAVARKVACPTCGVAAGKIPRNRFRCKNGHEFDWRACPAAGCGALSIQTPTGTWFCVRLAGRHD